jgi:hypothetical protein
MWRVRTAQPSRTDRGAPAGDRDDRWRNGIRAGWRKASRRGNARLAAFVAEGSTDSLIATFDIATFGIAALGVTGVATAFIATVFIAAFVSAERIAAGLGSIHCVRRRRRQEIRGDGAAHQGAGSRAQ